MKRKQWTALALSAILSFSACIPVTGIGVYAAENDVTQETVFEEAAESAFEETAEDSVFSGEDTGGDALSDPAADPFAAENAEAETPQAFDDAAEGAVESPEEAAVNASEPAGGEGAAPEAGNSFEEADPFEAEAGAEGAEYDTAADPAATEGTKFDAAADPAGAGGTEFEIPSEEAGDAFEEISAPADTAASESTEFDAAAAPASDPFTETVSAPADAAADEEQTFLTEDGQEEAFSERRQNSSIEPTEENFANAAYIAAGDVLDVNITREAPAFFHFIPAETGSYKIYSTNETNCDPGLILYDESGCNIGSADDENGNDFSYMAVFNEGSDYYLQAYCYGSEAVYQIHLEKPAFFVEHGETARLISPGEEVTLEVNAVSSSPLSYQWYLNDVPVEGETSSTFTFTPESHCYASCSVSDEDGNSENVNYEIFFETGLTASAAGDSTFSLDPGSSQTLAVEASANEGIELSYRWFNRTTEEYIESDSGDPARCTIENLQSYTEIICYVSDPYGNELSIDFTLHVELDPIDISGAEVTVAADGLTYDGKAKTPAVTVKYDGKALTAGTDYDVTYTGNISAGTNTAKATVTGKGKYKGTVEKTFSISKAAQDLKAGNLSIAFSASKKLTVTGAQGTVTYESRAPAVATVAADGTVTGRTIGSAKITVSAAGNANYLPAHAEVTITVTAAKLTAGHVTVDAEGLVYNGKDQTPAVTVKYGSTVLTAGTDYTVSYKNNINPGTATVIITGSGNYTGTKEVTFTINAVGWIQESGEWYYYKNDGTKLTNGWAKDSKGWYWLDASGKISKNKWIKSSGFWYYLGADGIMTTGWQKVDSKWYYMNSSGIMTTGWQKVGGNWYYMNSSGIMTTGWQKVGGKWYYMNSSGIMTTGWQKVSGKWYYMNSSGIMTTGWQKVGSNWYYMNSSGIMTTGWQKIGGKWYYMKSSGIMTTGWQVISGKWYYFDASGVWVR